jgi:hypothetical protein
MRMKSSIKSAGLMTAPLWAIIVVLALVGATVAGGVYLYLQSQGNDDPVTYTVGVDVVDKQGIIEYLDGSTWMSMPAAGVSVDKGSSVQIKVTPDQGYGFSWSGGYAAGTDNIITVTPTNDMVLTLTFTKTADPVIQGAMGIGSKFTYALINDQAGYFPPEITMEIIGQSGSYYMLMLSIFASDEDYLMMHKQTGALLLSSNAGKDSILHKGKMITLEKWEMTVISYSIDSGGTDFEYTSKIVFSSNPDDAIPYKIYLIDEPIQGTVNNSVAVSYGLASSHLTEAEEYIPTDGLGKGIVYTGHMSMYNFADDGAPLNVTLLSVAEGRYKGEDVRFALILLKSSTFEMKTMFHYPHDVETEGIIFYTMFTDISIEVSPKDSGAVSIAYGSVICDVYRYHNDWGENGMLYMGQDDGILYAFKIYDSNGGVAEMHLLRYTSMKTLLSSGIDDLLAIHKVNVSKFNDHGTLEYLDGGIWKQIPMNGILVEDGSSVQIRVKPNDGYALSRVSGYTVGPDDIMTVTPTGLTNIMIVFTETGSDDGVLFADPLIQGAMGIGSKFTYDVVDLQVLDSSYTVTSYSSEAEIVGQSGSYYMMLITYTISYDYNGGDTTSASILIMVHKDTGEIRFASYAGEDSMVYGGEEISLKKWEWLTYAYGDGEDLQIIEIITLSTAPGAVPYMIDIVREDKRSGVMVNSIKITMELSSISEAAAEEYIPSDEAGKGLVYGGLVITNTGSGPLLTYREITVLHAGEGRMNGEDVNFVFFWTRGHNDLLTENMTGYMIYDVDKGFSYLFTQGYYGPYYRIDNLGSETISTIDGEKLCDVISYTYSYEGAEQYSFYVYTDTDSGIVYLMKNVTVDGESQEIHLVRVISL